MAKNDKSQKLKLYFYLEMVSKEQNMSNTPTLDLIETNIDLIRNSIKKTDDPNVSVTIQQEKSGSKMTFKIIWLDNITPNRLTYTMDEHKLSKHKDPVNAVIEYINDFYDKHS